jgi:hypothetical protein
MNPLRGRVLRAVQCCSSLLGDFHFHVCIEESVWLVGSSRFESAHSSSIFTQTWRECAPWRNSQKNERETRIKRGCPLAAHEILADSRKARTHRKLLKIEGKEKLPGVGPPTPGVGSAARAARDRYFLTRTRALLAENALFVQLAEHPKTDG